jgi:hypothetical protein
MFERVVHVVEMACIFADCSTTTNRQNKFSLTINACWQNFFYDMCVTIANIVEEHHQHLAGCIGPLNLGGNGITANALCVAFPWDILDQRAHCDPPRNHHAADRCDCQSNM